MSTSQKPQDAGTPPYLSYPRFESFLEGMKGKPLPPRFDRSLVRSMSGAEQSQLGIALRFFKLIEGDDKKFTPRMSNVVAARGTDRWKAVLASELLPAYDGIVGPLESAATMGQLSEAFRERGSLSGSAQLKAIRFYIVLAREAGHELSPHYTSPSVTTPSGEGSKRAPARRTRRGDSGEPQGASAPRRISGGKQLQFTVPSGDIQVVLPESVRPREIDALAKYLKEYVEMMGTGEEE